MDMTMSTSAATDELKTQLFMIEPTSGTFPNSVGWTVAQIYIIGFKVNPTSNNSRFLLRIE